VFVTLDYLTGFAVAAMIGTVKSNTGLLGIASKALIFATVDVGHLVDGILGDGHMFRMQSSFFIPRMRACPSLKMEATG
jgi:phage-related holin